MLGSSIRARAKRGGQQHQAPGDDLDQGRDRDLAKAPGLGALGRNSEGRAQGAFTLGPMDKIDSSNKYAYTDELEAINRRSKAGHGGVPA
jgi:hypothetical protein